MPHCTLAPGLWTITGFADGDTVTVTGHPVAISYGRSTANPADLRIISNNNGEVSEIILAGVLTNEGYVSDQASAEAAAGFTFIRQAPSSPVNMPG